MYALALYRLNALDQRVPIACAAITTALGCVALLPASLQLALLIGLPISTLWLFRTTVNHARSFEDVLRRIEEIEREVNSRAGEQLLSFQSTHPSRGRWVGGRTGKESVEAVLVIAVLLYAGCGYIGAHILATKWITAMSVYAALLIGCAAVVLSAWRQMQTYQYRACEADRR